MRITQILAAVTILLLCATSRADTLTFTITSGADIASFQLGSSPIPNSYFAVELNRSNNKPAPCSEMRRNLADNAGMTFFLN